MNELEVLELQKKIERNDNFTLLDVRDAYELHISNLQIDSVHIPLDELQSRVNELDKSDEIVVLCRSGNRSATACDLLLQKGFTGVYNLKGGINEWAQKIDSTIPVY